MIEKKIIVDRIENGFAVCETDGDFVDIPISKIIGGVREGDMLCENGDGALAVVVEETQQRRDAIASRFERIKARKHE